MKKSSIVLGLLVMTGLFMPFSAYSVDTKNAIQAVSLTVSGSALLAIKTTSIGLSLSGAAEAGAAIQTVAQDSTTRLRISSLVDGEAVTRNISAKIDLQPVGADLSISVLAPTTDFESGATVQGAFLSDIILSAASAKNIITGIGTCWSGTETDSGYVIKYTYKMQDAAPVVTGTGVIVTYTLSDPT